MACISVDGKNDQIIANYGGGSRPALADMHWLGEQPMFVLGGDALFIRNLEGEVIRKIQTPDRILEIDVSPDGSYTAIACGGDVDDLHLVNTSSLEIRKITDSPEMVERYPRFPQDGKKILYAAVARQGSKDPPALKLYDLIVDSSYTLLLRDSTNKHFNPFTTPCFGRNDELVYFVNIFDSVATSIGTSKLYSLNLKSGEVTLIDDTAAWAVSIKYAPIGDRLVYLTEPLWAIRVYDAATKRFFDLGDKIQKECHAAGPKQILNINQQGTIVVAGTDYCSNTNIYSINVENAGYSKICLGTSPALSRDGKTLLYVKTRPIEY